MIHSKYNFKKYLRTKYPDIHVETIYNVPAYILDKPLSPQDMFDYGVNQFEDGKYIVFIGIEPRHAMALMQDFIENGIPKDTRGRELGTTAPTTYASFQDFLFRNEIQFKNRTYLGKAQPSNYLLDPNAILLDNETRAWYMYEFEEGLLTEHQLIHCPHATLPNANGGPASTVVFIKAPQSSYKSKRQLRAENFNLMQPLYEQIIIACNNEDWDKAVTLTESYKSIAFQKPQIVSKEELIKAWRANALRTYMQIDTESTSEEDF